jgi:hypothetical protein
MNKDTFDNLSEKKLGGPWAYMTGRVKITKGGLFTMKDFDNKILDKYFNKYYSSKAKDDYK